MKQIKTLNYQNLEMIELDLRDAAEFYRKRNFLVAKSDENQKIIEMNSLTRVEFRNAFKCVLRRLNAKSFNDVTFYGAK